MSALTPVMLSMCITASLFVAWITSAMTLRWKVGWAAGVFIATLISYLIRDAIFVGPSGDASDRTYWREALGLAGFLGLLISAGLSVLREKKSRKPDQTSGDV
jgi:hypothetical protein